MCTKVYIPFKYRYAMKTFPRFTHLEHVQRIDWNTGWRLGRWWKSAQSQTPWLHLLDNPSLNNTSVQTSSSNDPGLMPQSHEIKLCIRMCFGWSWNAKCLSLSLFHFFFHISGSFPSWRTSPVSTSVYACCLVSSTSQDCNYTPLLTRTRTGAMDM